MALGIVDYHKPDYLLSCGDWSTAVNEGELYELLEKVVVLTIYGNHENMDVLAKLYNVRTGNYLPVLMEEGKVYDIGGLKVVGINGIIAKKRKTRKGVPRRTPEEFLEAAEKLRNKNVDILLIHETPYLPNLFPFMARDFRSESALKAVKIVKPRVIFNGHMHSGGYKTYIFPWGTRYIYIDSSQASRHYTILHSEGIEIWKDLENIDLIPIEHNT